MSGGASGLKRDLNLVRRRAWLFIPFFLLGILLSFAFAGVAGQANAVASLQLETVVHEVFIGGDRGLRIFEADAMTADAEFKQKVRERIGDSEFDYARFTISLAPHSVADGVARGVLTVSIKDDDRATAERYRQAWVDVFVEEYTALDGLFRRRFLEKREAVALVLEQEYQTAYQRLEDLARAKGITAPLDQLALRDREGTVLEDLSRQEAALIAAHAEAQATLAAAKSASPEVAAALASSFLGANISAAQATSALSAKAAALAAAIADIRKLQAQYSDAAFDSEFLRALDYVRALDQLKVEGYGRLANARGAVTSAESTVETSYSFSGGAAGTLVGRVAVVLAVTIVFGLIAIYTLEWLSQVSRGASD